MQSVALDPIAERARRTANELTCGLLSARDALSQAAAATFEWCIDVFDRLSQAIWSLLWRETPSLTPATIPTPTPPAAEAGQTNAADVSSCKSDPFGGPTDREPCTLTRTRR